MPMMRPQHRKEVPRSPAVEGAASSKPERSAQWYAPLLGRQFCEGASAATFSSSALVVAARGSRFDSCRPEALHLGCAALPRTALEIFCHCRCRTCRKYLLGKVVGIPNGYLVAAALWRVREALLRRSTILLGIVMRRAGRGPLLIPHRWLVPKPS